MSNLSEDGNNCRRGFFRYFTRRIYFFCIGWKRCRRLVLRLGNRLFWKLTVDGSVLVTREEARTC